MDILISKKKKQQKVKSTRVSVEKQKSRRNNRLGYNEDGTFGDRNMKKKMQSFPRTLISSMHHFLKLSGLFWEV